MGAGKAFAVMAVMALAGCVTAGPPRTDRVWYPYLARTTHVEMQQDNVQLAPVTDWSYAAAGPTSETYIDTSFRLEDVRAVWFVVEPDPKLSFAAHTFLLFEFTADRLLGLTIEARREANEEYSPIAGIFNQFELAYLWGTAHDLLTRRAVMLDHRVEIFPIAVDHDQLTALLIHLLERTRDLETHPRYYNTLFSNCTNEIAKAAGFHWAPAFILTGKSDEYLFHRHLIPGPSLAAARSQADMTQAIMQLNAAPQASFAAAILTELRARRAALTH